MITVIAKLKAQEGKEDEALALCKEMVQGVEKDEPDVIAYLCHQSKKDPAEIIFYEVYPNEEALANHRKTEHMAKMNKSYMGLFSGAPDIQMVERVEGFMR